MELSTERLLADHVRRHACGTDTTCPQLSEIFDLEHWHVTKFLPALLAGTLKPGSQTPIQPPNGILATNVSAHEEKFWGRPWVYCKNSNDSHTCSGSMSRDQWVDPQTRFSGCVDAVKKNAGNFGNVKVSFYLLNADTQKLCARSVSWRNEIQSILCQAAGNCPAQAFFYSPTAYSMANQEFVHDTVLSYYRSTGSTCPPKIVWEDQNQANSQYLEK